MNYKFNGENNVRTFLSTVMIFSNIFVIAFITLIIFWSVYPYKPIVFKDKVFHVIQEKVKAGGLFTYASRYYKKTEIASNVSCEYINGLSFSTPMTISNKPIGEQNLNITTIIPKELPPGKYVRKCVYRYQVNPIRIVTVIMQTEPFEVIN